MKVLLESHQSKIRNSQTEIFQVAELKRSSFISQEICDVFENAERRKPEENILKWWLGWSNHRQLLKVLRETRLDRRTPAATEMEEDKAEDVQVIADDRSFEELCLALEQLAIGDVFDGDYFDFDDEESLEEDDNVIEDVHDAEAQEEEDLEDSLPLNAAGYDEDQTLIDFVKNQMERMKMIRDQQLDVPNRIVSVSADQILTLPLGQRWMLFAQWMHSYNKLIQQDLRDTETEYKDKIVEYNQLKG